MIMGLLETDKIIGVMLAERWNAVSEMRSIIIGNGN